MSIDVSVWVWKHAEASGARLLVLLALADIANHDGVCWPSVPTLAQRTRLHEQTVRRHLMELRESGSIEVESVPGRSNRYTVLMGTPMEMVTPSDFRRGTETAQSTPTSPVEGTPTKPLKTNGHRTVKEPSEGKKGSSERGTRLPEDWQPGPGEVAYAREHAPSIDIARTVEDFVDYWVSKPGAAGRKTAWTRTWQGWVRREHDRNVERGWMAPAAAAVRPASADAARDAWLAERGVTYEEFLERRGEPGWLESLEAQVRRAS